MDVDLDAAAADGIISEDQVVALRNFQAQRTRQSLSMAEKFQIYGGLTDVVAAAGLALTLIASGAIPISARARGHGNDSDPSSCRQFCARIWRWDRRQSPGQRFYCYHGDCDLDVGRLVGSYGRPPRDRTFAGGILASLLRGIVHQQRRLWAGDRSGSAR